MRLSLEVIITTLVLVLFAHFLYGARGSPFIGKYYATIFAVTFLYVPVFIMWLKKRRIDFLDNSFKAFLKGVAYFIGTVLVVYPPYLLCAHFWMAIVDNRPNFHLASFPDWWQTCVFQVLLIALPEEFFFRGYMQGTLNRVFTKTRRIFGANIGLALPVTSLIFALSHSFVHYAWWHFAIFFPSLLFGWLKEKTGSITAPILFHAFANVMSDWIIRSYY